MALATGTAALIAAGISAAGSAASSGINADLSKNQRDWAVQRWKAQNRYNRPSSQVQRYMEAGLNPALMYGQGSPGNASTLPKYEKANIADPQIDIGGQLGKYQMVEQSKAAVELTKAQTRKANAEAQVSESSIPSDIMKRSQDAKHSFNKNELLRLEADLKAKEIDIKDLDGIYKQWRNTLWDESRMTMGDSMLYRMFGAFLNKIGVSIPGLGKWIDEQSGNK